MPDGDGLLAITRHAPLGVQSEQNKILFFFTFSLILITSQFASAFFHVAMVGPKGIYWRERFELTGKGVSPSTSDHSFFAKKPKITEQSRVTG